MEHIGRHYIWSAAKEDLPLLHARKAKRIRSGPPSDSKVMKDKSFKKTRRLIRRKESRKLKVFPIA